MSRELIDQYEQGSEKLALSIRGLLLEDLRQAPADDAPARLGKWSIQKVVIHVVDADLVIAERIKRVLAEENPALLVFDESAWADRLCYDEQSAEDAAALLALNRRQVTRILRHLPEDAFSRYGTHPVAGRCTLTDLVRGAVEHLDHHLGFIHAKRAGMGKELW